MAAAFNSINFLICFFFYMSQIPKRKLSFENKKFKKKTENKLWNYVCALDFVNGWIEIKSLHFFFPQSKELTKIIAVSKENIRLGEKKYHFYLHRV